jgi:1-acyl-sn-glycerol-3-phosphate acyltransferase
MTRVDAFYALSIRMVDTVLGSLYRIKCDSSIPKGPCIIHAKHQHWLDTPLLGVYAHRNMRKAYFVMRKFVFPINRIAEWYGGIPIARGRDVRNGSYTSAEHGKTNNRAMQTSVRLLKRGELLISHPEGTRAYKMMGNLKTGFASQIIHEFGKTVAHVPVGIEYENVQKQGTSIWIRAAGPVHTEKTEELERILSRALPILSNCQ